MGPYLPNFARRLASVMLDATLPTCRHRVDMPWSAPPGEPGGWLADAASPPPKAPAASPAPSTASSAVLPLPLLAPPLSLAADDSSWATIAGVVGTSDTQSFLGMRSTRNRRGWRSSSTNSPPHRSRTVTSDAFPIRLRSIFASSTAWCTGHATTNRQAAAADDTQPGRP